MYVSIPDLTPVLPINKTELSSSDIPTDVLVVKWQINPKMKYKMIGILTDPADTREGHKNVFRKNLIGNRGQ